MSESPIKPISDRIIVVRDRATNTTATGLLLPDETQSNTGIIIAIGEKVEDKERISVGSKIVFPRYGGQEITINNKTYVILRESELFGTLKGE